MKKRIWLIIFLLITPIAYATDWVRPPTVFTNSTLNVFETIYNTHNYYTWGWTNTSTTVSTDLNVNVTLGNVTVAGHFIGDGSLLTGVSATGGILNDTYAQLSDLNVTGTTNLTHLFINDTEISTLFIPFGYLWEQGFYNTEGNLTGLLDDNYYELTDKVGNTTQEIRQQFKNSSNISIIDGVISINDSFSTGAHTINSNASSACGDGEYLDGDGFCVNFNDTVNTLFAETQVVYNATSINTETGTLDGGDISYIQGLPNGELYNVSEVSGSPGFMIYVNFTNVIAFNVVALAGQYVGGAGHTPVLELYRVGDDWEEREEITDQTKQGISTFDVFIGSDFINTSEGNGTVQFRLNHDDNGVTSHDYLLDTVLIGQVSGIVVGGDLDDLTGRDEACLLLPDVFCKDGSKNMTGNFLSPLYNYLGEINGTLGYGNLTGVPVGLDDGDDVGILNNTYAQLSDLNVTGTLNITNSSGGSYHLIFNNGSGLVIR